MLGRRISNSAVTSVTVLILSLAATFSNLDIASAAAADIIVDQLDTNTSRTGRWQNSKGDDPYASRSLYSIGSNSRFTWYPDLPAAGTYEVYAWWTYYKHRSNSVPYQVEHDDGTDTIVVNQRKRALGGQWQLLGIYELTPGANGMVTVSGENGQAAADAVRFVAVATPPEVNDPPPADTNAPDEVIVDQLDINTSRLGNWKISSGTSPYALASLYANDADSTFTWYPELPVTGSYKVYAWWSHHDNRSIVVPYRVEHDNGIATIIVNQNDPDAAGQWQLLGTYELTPGANGIVTVSAENGQAAADAVRFVTVDSQTGSNDGSSSDSGSGSDTGSDSGTQSGDTGSASPPPNGPPSISGTPAGTVTVNQAYGFTPLAGDPDNDVLYFEVAGLPAWADFDSATGTLSGSPTDGDAGLYDGIEIRVSDGQHMVGLAAFSIEVVQIAVHSVTLNWQPPTQNTDGTTLIDLAGYRICYGNDPDAMNNWIDIDNAGLTSYVVENLGPAVWQFEIFAINGQGMASDASNLIVTDLRN